jgi:hypothetical protein
MQPLSAQTTFSQPDPLRKRRARRVLLSHFAAFPSHFRRILSHFRRIFSHFRRISSHFRRIFRIFVSPFSGHYRIYHLPLRAFSREPTVAFFAFSRGWPLPREKNEGQKTKNENPPVFGFSFSRTPHHVPTYT